jgi:transposase-like protein
MSDSPSPDPAQEYRRRLTDRRHAARRFAGIDRWLSHARLATLGAAALMAWLAWSALLISPYWLAVPVVAFGVLVFVHGSVAGTRQRYERAVDYYERGLAHLEDRWDADGEDGHRFLTDTHLYAADLDIVGPASLFQRVNAARTGGGEDTLAAWLLVPAAPDVIRARQEAVRELTPLLDLREELALLGSDLRTVVRPEALAAWSTAPPLLDSGIGRAASLMLGGLAGSAFVAWASGITDLRPVAAAVAANVLFGWTHQARVRRVIRGVGEAGHELTTLAQVLARLEREPFTSARLLELRASLDSAGVPPSRQIASLRRLVSGLEARNNQLFAPFSALLLWATSYAYAIEAWRTRSGAAVPRWIAAVGEFEALCSIAGYAFENPGDVYPVIDDDARRPLFDGEALGHPLIPATVNVRNTVRLLGTGRGDGPRTIVVSGSNMSGKSTLLRTVGVNAVLALAGAPVRASRLTLTPLAIGATLRVQDSLQGGTSRFYAEITRLRHIVDETNGPLPPLFLLDEMLNGTNSRDRGAGAEALIKGLVARGAVGLVTTHDLALSSLADAMAPLAANVHFEDHLEAGVMKFDYVCRPGVMTRSNALELMRAVGLQV